MKYFFPFLLSAIITSNTMAQNRSFDNTYLNYFSVQEPASFLYKSLWPSFFSRDRQQLYRPKSIPLITLTSSASPKAGNYWMGSMTTQSYNKGKLGTYYMWDVQGNLRESPMFLDIAGKNKRGLKLVFRRR